MSYRTALITGASSGIGRGIAERLAERGVKVVLVARRKEMLDEVADRIGTRGGSAITVAADVADTASLVAKMTEIDDEVGGIDLVIANAALGVNVPGTRMTFDRIAPMLQINFVGAIATLTALLPKMVARRSGHLVGVSSIAAFRGLPTSSAYSATKAGLSTFLEGLRVDLRGSGVDVTTVHPGFVRTDMTAKNRFPMPFLLELDDACDRVIDGIYAKKRTIDFPAPLVAAMTGVAAMPASLYELLASKQKVR
jgi:short-subunit dehydrogenase